MSAFASISSLTALQCPPEAAYIRAVQPSLSFRSTFALFSISSRIMPSRLPAAADISAVVPSLSTASTFTFALTNASTIFRSLPKSDCDAQSISGVLELSSRAFGSAPAASAARIASSSPEPAASISCWVAFDFAAGLAAGFFAADAESATKRRSTAAHSRCILIAQSSRRHYDSPAPWSFHRLHARRRVGGVRVGKRKSGRLHHHQPQTGEGEVRVRQEGEGFRQE